MFYDILKQECEKQNIKMTPLVSECGGATGSIGNWKKGASPNSDIVLKLAKRLNVSTDYLLGRTDNPSNQTITSNGSGSTIVGLNNSLNNSSISIDDKQDQSLSDDIKEIVRIYGMLDVKKRHRLLNVAFALEEEMENERND